ncbi:hypothetical protein Tco_0144978 [Tanacetum coccineum]
MGARGTNGGIRPFLANASPTALSPGYIANFDPEEDEEDPEEDPANHPVDGGDNDDNESSDDDEDDDDVSLKDTEAFETDESASTPPTSPHHIILFLRPNPMCMNVYLTPYSRSPSAEACITEFAAALPLSLPPPPENIKSLKDNIRG